MTPRSLICVLTVLIAAPASGQAQRGDANAHADRGLELARAGHLAEGEAELRQAVDLHPRDAAFLSSLGTVLAMEGKFEESTTILKRALAITPNDLTVRRYLAANFWQLHNYPEAKTQLDFILKQKPTDPAARLLRGMVAENSGDYATAARMLSSVPDQVNRQPEAIAALAMSYYRLGQKDKARATLRLLETHPGVEAILLGAQIADQMRDYQTAIEMLKPAVAAAPDQAQLAYRLGLAQYHAEEYAECESTLKPFVDGGANSEIYNLMGWAYQKQNSGEQAAAMLNQAIRIAPAEQGNYVDLVKILLLQRSLPAARSAAQRATAAFPDSSQAFELSGTVQIAMSQFRDAVTSFARAKQLDPTNSNAVLGLGDAQFAAGLPSDARGTYERGLQQFRKDPRFPVHYAGMLLKLAEGGGPNADIRADQLLKAAIAIDPAFAEAHYQRGEIALRNGRTVDAIKFLERAVQLDPASAEAHFALARAYRRAGRTASASREMDQYNKRKQSAPATRPSQDAEPETR